MTGYIHPGILNRWAKTKPSSPKGNFFSPLRKKFQVFSKMPRSNKSEAGTECPCWRSDIFYVLWSHCCKSPHLSIGNRWNAISTSESFCFSPRSAMPGWSPSVICYLPYASQSHMQDHSQWVYWFAPATLRDCSPRASCWYASQLAASSALGSRGTTHCAFRNLTWRKQVENHLQSCQNGKAPLGSCTTNGDISTWNHPASEKKPLSIARYH